MFELAERLKNLAETPTMGLRPSHIDPQDLRVLAHVAREEVRPVDIAEMLTAKGVALGILEIVADGMEESFRLRTN